NTLQLSPSHGTLWQGNTQVSTLTPNLVHLGKIDWQLSFWSLLMGQAQVQNVWQKEQSQLRSQVTFSLFSEQTKLKATNIDGTIGLPLLVKLLNLTDLQNMDVSGLLQINEVNLTLDLASQWPSVLTGNLVLKQLNVLGETFPNITITPKLEGDKLLLNIEGKEQGWSLSGKLEVFKNKRFTVQLKVTAQSPSSLPSWAEMLQKQSSTVAVLNHRGVW
ncbi:MAG: type II secretion system protein N, partial [Thiomicrorhabdus sp.]|nr:type II secretion system protein N [Thiomicrorhabdus sp.]